MIDIISVLLGQERCGDGNVKLDRFFGRQGDILKVDIPCLSQGLSSNPMNRYAMQKQKKSIMQVDHRDPSRVKDQKLRPTRRTPCEDELFST